MVEVTELSDKELRQLLTEHGQTVGPLTGTTRRVYELLLEQILNGTRPSSRNSTPSKDKKKRRQTLDTSVLRSTQKPKVETRRRSEHLKPKTPSLNLSDYSDTELAVLDPTPDLSPPQTLIFSSPTTTRRRTSTKLKPKLDDYDPTLFSDEDEQSKPKKKPTTKTTTKPCSINKMYLVCGLLCGILAVSTGYYVYNIPPPPVVISPLCNSITLDIPLMECDRIFRKLAAQKDKLDIYSGQVMCGQKEGNLYRASPEDETEKALLFEWREVFNYTIYIKKESLYLEVESEAEISDLKDPNSDEIFFYKSDTPYISWSCKIFNIVNKFMYYILISLILAAIAQLAYKLYGWKRAKAKQETGQMYELIDQIIEELQRNYSKYQTDPINYVPYVPIPHARDRLLLPSERSQMKHIWERAVHFIAQHESRVRVEMRRVQAEDFPVWYWIEASKPVAAVQPDSTSSEFLYPNLDTDTDIQEAEFEKHVST